MAVPHGVQALGLHGAVALPREARHFALQQIHLVEDHRQGVVDLMGEAHGHLAQGRELILAQDLTQVLGEADRAVLLALLVAQDRSGDGDGDALAGLGEEGGLEGLDDVGPAVTGLAHGLHHALRLGEVRVETGGVLAEDFLGAVAQAPRRAVVVIVDVAIAVGGDDDVSRARDELLESVLAETQDTKSVGPRSGCGNAVRPLTYLGDGRTRQKVNRGQGKDRPCGGPHYARLRLAARARSAGACWLRGNLPTRCPARRASARRRWPPCSRCRPR